MRGVNGDGAGTTADGRPMTGALRFEARVRVFPTRRHARADRRCRRRPRCRRRHVAHRGGDQLPDVRRRERRSSSARRGGARSRIAQERRCAARRSRPRPPVSYSIASRSMLGPSKRVADRRARACIRRWRRSRSRRALFPVRPLPAHCQLAAGFAAGEPAGHLERQHVAAVGQQVHHQHQHPDELLAGALDQPRRDDGAADGDGVGFVGHRRANGA